MKNYLLARYGEVSYKCGEFEINGLR